MMMGMRTHRQTYNLGDCLELHVRSARYIVNNGGPKILGGSARLPEAPTVLQTRIRFFLPSTTYRLVKAPPKQTLI